MSEAIREPSIRRWSMWPRVMTESKDGEFVTHADHLTDKTAALTRLRQTVCGGGEKARLFSNRRHAHAIRHQPR